MEMTKLRPVPPIETRCGQPLFQATQVLALRPARIFKSYAAGRHPEPVGAFIFGATAVVLGPRSFSYTTP